MAGRETVALETLDGDQFEKFCKRIFERLGYGRVTNIRYVGDKGRDLLIESSKGLIVVECKHQPRSSVGRPVVQKLHSAVVSSEAERGIIVTTGKFSKAAINHATELRPPIELVDINKLTDMATRAGIDLAYEGRKRIVWSYSIQDIGTLELRVGMFLDDLYVSYPNRPSEIVSLSVSLITLIPTYEIRYNVDSIFKTTVGVVHHETKWDGRILISGDNGSLIRDQIQGYMSRAPMSEFLSLGVSEVPRRVVKYSLGSVMLKEYATNHIIQRHTRTVSYYGRNNIRYSKTCVPRQRDVELVSINQVYLPIFIGKVTLFRTTYPVEFVDNDAGRPLLTKSSLAVCSVCRRQVTGGKPYLCNDCGAVSHPKRVFSSHGFRCKDCGKTICRDCTLWVRRFLFFKRYICQDCAEKWVEKGKVPRRLKRLREA